MSATKDWLADPANYTGDTVRLTMSSDPGLDFARRMVIRKRMLLRSGMSMSVQYSPGHYCNGRERFMGGDMESASDPMPEPRSVEVGFPSVNEWALKPYAEEAWTPMFPRTYDRLDLRYSTGWWRLLAKLWPQRLNLTGTVFGWVPVDVVDYIINRHGGIVAYEGEYPE